MPTVPATRKVEAGSMKVQCQPGQLSETVSEKKKKTIRMTVLKTLD
jgi:hypothetical protein